MKNLSMAWDFHSEWHKREREREREREERERERKKEHHGNTSRKIRYAVDVMYVAYECSLCM